MHMSWAEIDLGVLDQNIRRAREALRPECSVVFVVKANAYGHGLVPVARQAARSGVRWFAVAYLQEALQVRQVAEDAHIVVLGAVEPGDVACLAENRILPVIVDESHGLGLAAAARALGVTIPVHLKVDTGMGRFGVPWSVASATFGRLAREGGLRLSGLCTHFASVEPRKPAMGPEQMERFHRIGEEVARIADGPIFRHASSSRAFLWRHDWDLDGVRPGIILYGYGAGERGMRIQTSPVLQWRTHVMQVKRVPAGFAVGYYSLHVTPAPTTIATIACGYADGYHRALSNRGFVLIRGRRCAVIGRVSMNWITVDCGPDSEAQVGDEVVLIGRQGHESVWANDLARLARTIPYEILTSIQAQAERRYRPAANLPLVEPPQVPRGALPPAARIPPTRG